ncbi:MAG: adenylate cyclase [Cytophagaceae bacterium]|nr:adenylate cyclase [Cytophagaceae bacterium]
MIKRLRSLTANEIRFYVKRAIWIIIAWMLISNLLFLFEYSILDSNGALAPNYNFAKAFISNLVVGAIAGVIGGVITVNIMEIWLRKFAFWKALLLIIILYVVTAIVVSTLGALYFYSNQFIEPFDALLWEEVRQFYSGRVFLHNFLLWLIIVLLTLITLLINDKFGPGMFTDYLLGRYFQPKSETRIFMFADIKDATTIAEDLGEEAYFNFLKDFFNDIAPAIAQTKGEVYQYVGDEVVLTWKMHKGLTNANVLRCYYRMQRIINKKAPKYLLKYQAVPRFKVGIHCGQVMVGELGKIKRDIAFSGDVLNTTARIQAQCNVKGVSILTSKVFADQLKKLPKNWVRVELGNELLKGKSTDVSLVTFEKVV